jgi:PEP-CTERM motif
LGLSRWVVAGAVAVVLSLPSFASAAPVKIGELKWQPFIEYMLWEIEGGFYPLPIAGNKAHVENDSPIDFLNVFVGAGWHYVGINATNFCPFGVVGAGAASPECSTGPVEPAPALPNGIFYEAFMSGELSASSFLLPDGTTFIPNSTSFAVYYTTPAVSQVPILNPIDIFVEGRIIQQEEPPQAVPEPGTLALIASGAVSAYTVRRRRR